ncbi:UTRA domain-containing protein [Paracoccus sp. S-4012]|uniref:UTRA domain-containing protein n=1 Tax=Paracoccus sp. S-4012 TaxID=2665648 RepID=UPI0012B13419|nr:UTRA domain-containing protein [Paracoccus sp. S-4012]MRX51944.1 UTRA domain-containing protein [Paracoccus sp. S-4012]
MLEAPVTWQAIRDEALARIRSRRWPPGELIPSETDLAREFGCARATVSRALRELAEAGYLDRRRRAGTRVALTPVRKATLKIPVLRHEVAARGARYGYALISSGEKPAPLHVSSVLGLEAGMPLLHVLALHLADGAPYALEDRWINAMAAPGIEAADLAAISANEWLVRNAPYSHGDLVLSAAAADAETAAILRCPEGAALFVAERATWLHDTPITSVRQSYSPGYRLATTL